MIAIIMASDVGSGTAPVILDHVTKHFGEVRAVNDLSFKVEAGHVVGLLGPNGAGKTTALRMLVGLVHPDAGHVTLFGEEVRPGTPALGKVGALIEGPAFVPHLSGLKNLDLYWKAGRKPLGDPAMEDALEVAGLGDAIERKVGGYSLGMRQRLGLAQALLGRPLLVVLDEPTNGLDPAQMREVREVVRAIAERGATVLLSSHLLAEVEQICSHVVVMDKGHLVTSGLVRDIVNSSGQAYVEVDDREHARSVLQALPTVTSVETEGAGLRVRTTGAHRGPLVAALVQAGLSVETVTTSEHLEDAFIRLVDGQAALETSAKARPQAAPSWTRPSDGDGGAAASRGNGGGQPG